MIIEGHFSKLSSDKMDYVTKSKMSILITSAKSKFQNDRMYIREESTFKKWP